MPSFRWGPVQRIRTAITRLRSSNIDVSLTWVPSHGKAARVPLDFPAGLTEDRARLLNERADAAAGRALASGLGDSPVADYVRSVAEATVWSTSALSHALAVQERYLAFLSGFAAA
mmetsp:Transcript_88588/g.255537  ORF Transcript_88588/g.255537 Transcript_88588/m.255537 type:complete len:116 (+) Transcript_88588:132-479(+)